MIRGGHRDGDVEPFTISIAVGLLLQMSHMCRFRIEWRDYSPRTYGDLTRIKGSETKVYLDLSSG